MFAMEGIAKKYVQFCVHIIDKINLWIDGEHQQNVYTSTKTKSS